MDAPQPVDFEVDGKLYRRLPLPTHVLTASDDPGEVVERYAKPHYEDCDIVFLSETCVAIMQGRARDWRHIRPSWLARKLAAMVTKSPYGVGLRSPYAMQYAIELCGMPRILMGCLAHVAGRLLKRKRWFYDVAGIQARMMDAEHTMGIGEFYEYVIPGPANPQRVVREIKEATGMDAAIVDVNDIFPPWCIAATVSRKRQRLLEQTLSDNPLGQGDEQTPIGIWRQL
jgi:F420-0:gamma-glutamyl ligase-like protein